MVARSRRPRKAALAAITTIATLLATVALATLPAQADTAPASGTASTVSSDSLPAPQVNGVVWSQVVAGNTVYVGGNFTQAQPSGAAAGVGTVSRAGMLAYNLTTGALLTGFTPSFNAQVRGLAASADGSTIYAVGDFTTVSGTSHSRVVALDAATGAVRPGFTASANSSVIGVAVSGSTVYIGGSFTTVDGVSRTRAAAVSGTSGAVTAFAPAIPSYTVRALVVSPDGSKVVLGGSFVSLNGSTSPGQGLGAVDSATGQQNQTWGVGKLIYNHGTNSSIWSLSSDGTNVYGTGYVYGSVTDGNLEGAFNATWADGTVNWIEDCHGDSYSVAALGDAVYTVSHDHYCGNVPGGFAQTDPDPSKAKKQYALAFSKSVAGTLGSDPYGNPYYNFAGTPAPKLLTWYPDLTPGSFTGQTQAAWNIIASGGYLLLGGEFPTVNGQRQVGLARFATSAIAPDKDGPRLSGTDFSSGTNWKATAVSLASGTVRVSWPANWDRDNANLTYTVKRGSTTVYTTQAESEGFWLRPALGFTDTGLSPGSTASYTVTATDPFGNSATSAAGSTTVSSGTGTSAYSNDVISAGASDYWRLGEASGPTVYDWAGYSDLTAGSGVAFGAAGAIQNDSSTAATFSGSDDASGLASTTTAIPGPDTFSIETWFKTTSTSGGKIVGFGNASTGNSSSYDRHVFMDGNGTVYFGVYNGSTSTVQSTSGFNDGKWHYVVASLSSAGMQLFLDGKKVGARTDVTTGQAYNGYWRLGGDSTWAGSNYFAGSIDDTAIYPTALSTSTVKAHYADAGYGTVATAPTDAYGKQIFAQGPDTYWRLGDAAGSTTVADASGNGATGNVSGGVGLGAAGGVSGTTDTAATFDGANGLVVSSQQAVDPEVYTLQLWFRTTTTTGGVLVGFGDNPSGESNNYDRHILMRDSGQLEFGIWTGQPTTVTSSASYNDGAWHQVVATQGADGLTMYVDGQAVGNNPATTAQAYSGYWRLGGDHAWGGNSSEFFNGTLDEVAIYSAELTSAQIANDYQLGATTATNTPPTAAFTATPAALKVALDASASTDPDGTVASYAWDFGDGSAVETDTTATTNHTYASAGTYPVTLTVTDDKGATNTIVQQVTVNPANVAPTAAFSSNVTGLGASFDATGSVDTDGTIASYAWDFGDGTPVETDTTPTTTHTYTGGGPKTVTLTVTDDDGATDSVTHTVSVSAPNQAPVAAFTTAVSGLTANVDASTSTDSDGTVASYAWTFGDGGTATGRTASHTYAAGGTYTVTLTVTDDGGATGATSNPVTVAAASSSTLASDAFNRTVSGGLGTADTGGAWTVSSTASDYSVSPGAAQLATAAGSTRSAYLGSVSSVSSDVSTTISLPGLPVGGSSYAGVVGRRVGTTDYNARILVGATGAVTIQVDRDGTALKSATVSGLTYTAGLPVKLRLQTTGTNPTTMQARVWKASDAEPTTWQVSATDTTAALQAPGSVGLRSYLSSGATSGKTSFSFSAFGAQTVGAPTQNSAPTASFTATTNALGVTVDGSASTDSDGTVGSYAWDFGDGATATGATASHTFAASGTYTVTLTVTDDQGAKGTASKQVVVTAGTTTHIAADAFGRTVTGGLGTADTGGAWTVSNGATNYSVGNGSAVFSTAKGATQSAYLSSVSSTSSDVSVSVIVPALPVGGSIYAGVVGRRVGTDDYNARILVSATGAVTIQVLHAGTALKSATVSGLTAAAGSVIHLRMQATGTGTTTVQARTWLDGATQPGTWQVSATDTTAALQAPGSVGLRTYVSSGLTNAPLAIRFDDLVVDPAN